MLQEICDRFLDEAMELNDLPGLVIGVSWHGEEFTGARGVRDVTTGDPLQADDVFHCASLSKLFTGTAIMKLVEAGVLDLDDRLCDILPELFRKEESGEAGEGTRVESETEEDEGAETGEEVEVEAEVEKSRIVDRRYRTNHAHFIDPRWREIRLYQMLSHTAGIGDVTDYHWEQTLTGETALSDYVHSPEVTDPPLLWAPGEGGFRYSNIAYEILGHIVSVRSGVFLKAMGEDADTGSKPVVLNKPATQNGSAMHGGAAVQAKPAMSYEDFVQRFLLEPAGMQDSTMLTFQRLGVQAGDSCPLITDEIRRRNAVSDRSTGSTEDSHRLDAACKTKTFISDSDPFWHSMALPHEKAADRSIVPVRFYPYTRSHAPSSTLTATASDVLRWARAHMEGFADVEAIDVAFAEGLIPAPDASDQPDAPDALLSFDSYRHIQYEYAEIPNNREKMGLSWFMRRQGGCRLYGHEGADDGFRSSLWICPQKDLAIVVLSNLSGAPVKKLNKKLFERISSSY